MLFAHSSLRYAFTYDDMGTNTMDKNVLKKYAIWARKELIVRVSQRAACYGVTESGYGDVSTDSVNGRVLSASEKKQRQALIAQIQKKGYEEVIEEVAYTWFNRFLALRFMEVNGYLPSRVKTFTDSDNHFKPQILTEAINLEIDGLDMEKVYAYKDANQTEGLYKYLLVVQCNALNAVLPGMFQKIEDYTELLLPDKLLLEGSVIERMIVLIPEEDWKDAVQIIGWMYQYYNSEKKDEVFAALKKNVKITKENIPAATQLFTPDWIVRYMVENSLGRLWLEGHPNEELKSNWKYYLEEAEQEPEVEAELVKIRAEYAQLTPEDIRCIDPCQGSGHILVYMFDVLMRIYESYGYTAQEAVASIVKNNIYGLDIDERAAQLSYFAVMMKACQYDKRFLKRKDEDGKPRVPQPRVYAIQESNDVDSHVLEYFCNENVELKEAIETIMEEMYDAKEYGSIITVTEQNWDAIYARFKEIKEDISIYKEGALELFSLVQVAQALAQKYHVVVTNPPYMGINGGNTKLNEFVKKNYSQSKADLFAVFIERCSDIVEKSCYYAMITQQSWLSLPSFQEMRKTIFSQKVIVNMAQMGSHSFNEISGEVVSSVAFIIRKIYLQNYTGCFSDLQDGLSEEEKESKYLAGRNLHFAKQNLFSLVPNNVVVYDASENVLDKFAIYSPLKNFVTAKPGMQTSDNDRFLRFWQEVSFSQIGFGFSHEAASISGYKWFPYNKGIGYRKWYGNNDYIVNFFRDGEELKFWLVHNPKDPSTKHWSRNMRNYDYYFKEGITFTAIGNLFSARLNGSGYLFDTKGPMMFGEELVVICGFVNSVVFDRYNRILCKQLTKSVDSVNLVPFIELEKEAHRLVEELVSDAIAISKSDWNSFETSWDFARHPLAQHMCTIAEAYIRWESECEERFQTLKSNEEELNRIFIDIYGLQDELTPEVEDKDVTVRKADLQRDIKSLISYAVGCMFGRYSLDIQGLVYAGGDFNIKYCRGMSVFGDEAKDYIDENGDVMDGWAGYSLAKYDGIRKNNRWEKVSFAPDTDNIIPITDDEYFENDIVEKFIEFIRTVYGEKFLDKNLKFIADALGGKGQSREVIRNYFINDFYNDHCKIYQKRPIYWLFDSGKKNGFKCLIYMHRYEPDTIARIRTDYVHEQQSRYRTAIADLERRIANAGTSERVKLNKSLKKIQEQADELYTYEEKIHHLADQMIAIDLDDGVKHNYEIFKDVLAKIK